MNGQTEKQHHEFTVNMRREMKIEGVREVDRFDETEVVLRTAGGEMTVEGSELKIGVLDTQKGLVTLSGRIDGVFYSAENTVEKKGFLGRLLR